MMVGMLDILRSHERGHLLVANLQIDPFLGAIEGAEEPVDLVPWG